MGEPEGNTNLFYEDQLNNLVLVRYLLYFYFLAVDSGPIEFFDGVFGVLNVFHGDECVSFSCDENIVHSAKLVEFPLK